MITGLHTSCAEECGWLVPLERAPSIHPLPFPHKFLLTPLLSAFSPLSSAGPFASGSAYVLFIPIVPSSLRPCAFYFYFCWFVVVLLVKKIKNRTSDVMHCRLWASPSCFFLVTLTFLLSHRHLALAALLARSSSSSSEPSSDSAAYSVAWSGPAPGDRFGSGDTIVGEWQVTPQNQKVVSPSFRLCMGGEDGCGATIWPEVVEESEGSYSVSLYVRRRLFFLAKKNKNKNKNTTTKN
jgi:hypothetical protein